MTVAATERPGSTNPDERLVPKTSAASVSVANPRRTTVDAQGRPTTSASARASDRDRPAPPRPMRDTM